MYICNLKGVDPNEGEFLLLSDLGSEGIIVVSQHDTVHEAILDMDGCYQQLAIVRVVDIQVVLTNESGHISEG